MMALDTSTDPAAADAEGSDAALAALRSEVEALRLEVETAERDVAGGRDQLELLARDAAITRKAEARLARVRQGSRAAAERMKGAGATGMRLLLFNDPVNKRERVEQVRVPRAPRPRTAILDRERALETMTPGPAILDHERALNNYDTGARDLGSRACVGNL